MELPQFLLADNTDFPDSVFIIHNDFPRFIWNIVEDEVEWLDDLKGEEDDLVQEIAHLLERAENFYDREMKRLEEGQH
jgi:hypothetical protein